MRLTYVALALVGVALASCGGNDSDSARVNVVATTTQVGDVTRVVGGKRADVHQILGANSDPHTYEPRPSDAAALADAGVIFRSGGDTDEWLSKLMDAANGDASIVDLSDSVDTHGDDPHWWQDPRNMIRATATMLRTLRAADPDGASLYTANARNYIHQLRRLDIEVARCIHKVPSAQRKLVTTHDTLGYYVRRYGIDVVGFILPSLSSAAQTSIEDVNRLVDEMRRQDVRAIFPDHSLDPRGLQSIALETGAMVGEALWSDALGPRGSGGETYIESIQANTSAIVEALTGGHERCEFGG